MSRMQRRQRGIRVERYQIEMELGRVRHVLKLQDTSSNDNRALIDTSTPQ